MALPQAVGKDGSVDLCAAPGKGGRRGLILCFPGDRRSLMLRGTCVLIFWVEPLSWQEQVTPGGCDFCVL